VLLICGSRAPVVCGFVCVFLLIGARYVHISIAIIGDLMAMLLSATFSNAIIGECRCFLCVFLLIGARYAHISIAIIGDLLAMLLSATFSNAIIGECR